MLHLCKGLFWETKGMTGESGGQNHCLTWPSKHRFPKGKQWPSKALKGAAVFRSVPLSDFSPCKKRHAGKGNAKASPAENKWHGYGLHYRIFAMRLHFWNCFVLHILVWGNNHRIAQYWPWNRYSGLWKPCYSTKLRQHVGCFHSGKGGGWVSIPILWCSKS